MAKQTLGLGTSPNDHTGDSLRIAGGKINNNFNELYSALGNGTTLTVAQVAKSGSYADLIGAPTFNGLNVVSVPSSLTSPGSPRDVAIGAIDNINYLFVCTANNTWKIIPLRDDPLVLVSPPTHSYGKLGDRKGLLAVDDNSLYYCISDYVNNSTEIWKSIPWGGGGGGSALTIITPEEYEVQGVNTLAFAGDGVTVDRINEITTVTIEGGGGPIVRAPQAVSREFNASDVGFTASYSVVSGVGTIAIQTQALEGLYFKALLNRLANSFATLTDPNEAANRDFFDNYDNVRIVLNPDSQNLTRTVTLVTTNEATANPVYTLRLNQVLPSSFTITDITFLYDYTNTSGFDTTGEVYGVALDNQSYTIRTNRDINLEAADDVDIEAGSTMQLILRRREGQNNSSGIELSARTEALEGTTNKDWKFRFDGKLELPTDGDIVDSSGNSVLGINNESVSHLELTQSAFIVQNITLGNVVTFTKANNATGEEAVDDIIPNVLALTRGSIRGLYNPYRENAYDNTDHSSPLGTLWNADGWGINGVDVNYRNRKYVPLREALGNQIGDNIIGAQLIMWDTTNNNYYKFEFTEWSEENGGGFEYDRQLINDPNVFTKPNNGTNFIDIIVPNDPTGTGIGLTRGNAQGLYNPYREQSWNSNVSPSGTVWNVDGWSDLTNITTRTYTTFYNAFDQQIGNNILDKECVMYVEDTDTYYAVKFNKWAAGGSGGGFSYSLYEIDMDELQEGITFADGTVQKTAYVPPTPASTRIKSTAARGRRIEEVTGSKSVTVTARVLNTAVETTAAQNNSGNRNQVMIVDTEDALSDLNNSGVFLRIEVSLDETTWYPAYVSGYGGGNTTLALQNSVTLVVADDDVVYYRTTTGGDPVVWWDKDDLPGGSNDFRGAIIDYHAYTGETTIIGTIHIVDDDGEDHITHTEVSSGDTDGENDDLWIVQDNQGEGTISYRRLDGESKTLRTHWTAKVFYGDEYYDD